MAAELTIERLAAVSGMTVRNIRAHQARGLLGAPEVRVRVGYYGPEHVAQLKLIRELQDDGFNLAGIKRLLSDRERTEERLARFRRSLTQRDDAERPETVTGDQLRRRFSLSAREADQMLIVAERMGILIRAGDARFRAPRPSLLDLAEEVVSRGIVLSGALAVFEDAERHCDAVAASFVRLFVHDVWRPFEQAGMPTERWPEVDEAIGRLRELAAAALVTGFNRRIGARIDAAFQPPGGGVPAPAPGAP